MLSFDTILAARAAAAPFVERSRLERNTSLSREFGCDVWLKLELFQKTGSFKVRGSFAQLVERLDDAKVHGVVAVSGGNFAQGIAYAARTLGVRCKVLMAGNTPSNYVEATAGYGAEVEFAASIAAAFERAEAYVTEGWVPMHPYANDAMVAGSGVIGLELAEDLPGVTDVVISIGGGGLIAGVASALAVVAPQARVWGVETIGADVVARSLAAGSPQRITPTSLARTLGAPDTTELVLDTVRERVSEVLVLSDAEAFEGTLWFHERARLVAELAAGCTLSAARRLRADGRIPDDATVALIVCGANVSLATLCDHLARFGPGAVSMPTGSSKGEPVPVTARRQATSDRVRSDLGS